MHRRVTGQQARGLRGEQLAELGDGGVGLLGHVEPAQPAARVDHEQRRGVGDLAALDRRLDRRSASRPASAAASEPVRKRQACSIPCSCE